MDDDANLTDRAGTRKPDCRAAPPPGAPVACIRVEAPVNPKLSFEDYVRARFDKLSRIAFLLTGDRQMGEDLAQTALIRVASRWEEIVARGDPDAYVRRALYTIHVSWWRHARRQASPPDPAERSGRGSAADAVVSAIVVRQALARLTKRQRTVLVLRYLEDLTEVQAARVLGCSVGTVKSTTRDALDRLRRIAPELAEFAPQQDATPSRAAEEGA